MNILYDLSSSLILDFVHIPWTDARDMRAGTPVDANGAEANDGNAVGILLFDGSIGDMEVINGINVVHAKIIRRGYVDLAKAQASYGEYTDACKQALADIIFVDGKLPEGTPLPTPTAEDDGKALVVEDGEYVLDEVSGLPDPSGLYDGTALVVGKGAWQFVDGYAYFEEEPELRARIDASEQKSGRVTLDTQVFSGKYRAYFDEALITPLGDFEVLDHGEKLRLDLGTYAIEVVHYFGNQFDWAITGSVPPFITGFSLCFIRDVPTTISEDLIPNCVPDFTSSDNGKVLGVVNGALAWVSLT